MTLPPPKESAKERVLKVHPKATSTHFAGSYFIHSNEVGKNLPIGGSNLSFRQAWVNAAANLPKKGKKR